LSLSSRRPPAPSIAAMTDHTNINSSRALDSGVHLSSQPHFARKAAVPQRAPGELG
jgi:hypothetical protein